MSTQGPRYAATISQTAQPNRIDWVNIGSLSGDDAAAATFDGTAFSFNATQIVSLVDFGFTIPSGATIDGITVEIERKATLNSSGIDDNTVRLIKGGVVSGTNNADLVTVWPTAYTVATYGGDLWGLALTDTDVNAADFGVSFRASDSDNGEQAAVDYIRASVAYTAVVVPPPATGGHAGRSMRLVYEQLASLELDDEEVLAVTRGRFH